MHKLTLSATLTLAGALAIGGCQIEYGGGGDIWGEGGGGNASTGHGSCDGAHGPGTGAWGDPCTSGDDCAPGLSCNDIAGLCVPDPTSPQPCASNDDCSKGFFCDSEAGQCAPSGVCIDDTACTDGFVCDVASSTCVPDTSPATCAELVVEQECIDRPDCEPVYAGVNCSCGPNCECTGGEPGCVCESFEFFKCDPTATL